MEMLISTLTKAGRFLLGIPMAVMGLFHFMGAEGMAKMVPIPGGIFWVYLTGAALVAAGVSIVIQKKSRLAAGLLAVMLLLFVLLIHVPQVMGGDQMAMVNLLKDCATAGGALVYASTRTDD